MFAQGNPTSSCARQDRVHDPILRPTTDENCNATDKDSTTSTLSALAKAKIAAKGWSKKSEGWSKKAQKRSAKAVQTLARKCVLPRRM